MYGSVVGKSIWDFIKFVMGMVLTLVVALLFVWGLSSWHGKVTCEYQAKKLGLVYDYDYLAGCYFYFEQRWVPISHIDYCRVKGTGDASGRP